MSERTSTRPSRESEAEPGSRTLFVALALFLVSILASHFTAFRTRVRLTSEGSQLYLTVNGRAIHGTAEPGRIRGIRIETVNSVFPMGGETLTVRQGGRLLLEDRLPGRFSLRPDRRAPLGDWYLDPQGATEVVYEKELAVSGDFSLEATFTGRSLEFTSIVLISDVPIYAQFRRGLLNNDFVLNVGGRVVAIDSLVSPLSEMWANTLDLVLRAVTAGSALVLLFLFLRAATSLAQRYSIGMKSRRFRSAAKGYWLELLVGGLVLVAFAIRLWVSRRVLEALAHTPDEVAYILQSRWLVSNKLFEVAPRIQEYLSVPFTYFRDGKWFTMYPIGWPLLLAIGELLGLPWIISPICGALYVLLLFLIGKELYGRMVGFAVAVLGAFSPMAILMSSSYLSHASAALMIALFLWLYLTGRRRGSPWLCGLSGASLGYAFAIRPMTALAIAVPFAAVLLREFSRRAPLSRIPWQLGAFFLGGLLGSAPVFLSNRLITGNALSFAYSYGANVSFSPKNLSFGIMYLDATAASLLPAVFGWGWTTLSGWPILALSLAFACVPFITHRAGRFDVLLAVFLVALPLSFLTWGYHGLHGYGPRFYFEAFLGIYLLTARGIFLLGGVDAEASPVAFRSGRATAAAAIGLLGLLTLSTLVTLLPRMRSYRGYNYVNGSLETAIAREAVQRALILFPNDEWFPWGEASRLLKSDLHADIVFAVSRPDNSKLFSFYQDRPVYTWEWQSETLVRTGATFSEVPSPPQRISATTDSRLSTVMTWWFLIAAIGIGASVMIGRMIRSRRSRGGGGPALSSPSDEAIALEQSPDDPFRSTLHDRIARPLVAAMGVLSAYTGQSLLTPGRLTAWLPLAGLPEGHRLNAGWMLLAIGALLFGWAWHSGRTGRRSQANTGRRNA